MASQKNSLNYFHELNYASSMGKKIYFPLTNIFNKKAKARISYAIVQWVLKTCLFIAGTKLEVIGLENVPRDRAVLYVGNHRSIFDILINYSLLPPLMGFVSKKEMKKYPFLNHWMKLVNCLFLDRDNIKEGLKTILEGVEQMKNGISMFIYPEGTRAKSDDAMIEFKEGSFKIAEKGDTILLAGKGHETYQVIGKERVHYDERQVVAKVLEGGF